MNFSLSAFSLGSLFRNSLVDGEVSHILLIGAVGEALESALVVARGLLDLLQGCLRLQERCHIAEAIVAIQAAALADSTILAIGRAARFDTLLVLLHALL